MAEDLIRVCVRLRPMSKVECIYRSRIAVEVLDDCSIALERQGSDDWEERIEFDAVSLLRCSSKDKEKCC